MHSQVHSSQIIDEIPSDGRDRNEDSLVPLYN